MSTVTLPKKLLLDSCKHDFDASQGEVQLLQTCTAKELNALLDNFADGVYSGLTVKQMIMSLKGY